MPNRSSLVLLQSLPMLAVSTAFIGMTSALLTAWFYGLGQQYGGDIAGVLLGTIFVIASVVVVACFLAFGNLWWPRPIAVLVAFPLGAFHGYVWAVVASKWLEPVLANFTFPLGPPWIVGSICALLGAATLPAMLPHKLLRSQITLVGASALLLAFFGPGLLLASCMLALLLDDGVVQASAQSPDKRVTALVIRDDCGATCSCTIRVDLKSAQRYVREIYRSDACDGTVTWQNATQFRVRDDDGGQQQFDTRMFGLSQ
jgi:hypothetical protein